MKKNLGNFVLIDASSAEEIVVGKLGNDGKTWQKFTRERAPALESLFVALEKISFEDAAGFLFCEGPGSILGIRIAAMAIRGKLALTNAAGTTNAKNVFSFSSLFLAAKLILRAFPSAQNFVVAAESRFGKFNVLRVCGGVPAANFSEISEAKFLALAGTIFAFPWKKFSPPSGFKSEKIALGELLEKDSAVFFDCPEILKNCGNLPEAANLAAAETYVKWAPQRHGGNA